MQSCNLAVSISALACCIADGKSAEEISLISSVLTQLGDTLATIAAQQALCSAAQSPHTFRSPGNTIPGGDMMFERNPDTDRYGDGDTPEIDYERYKDNSYDPHPQADGEKQAAPEER